MVNTALQLTQQAHPSPLAKQMTCRCLYSAEGHWGCADNLAAFLPDFWEQRSIVPFPCRTALDSYPHILHRGQNISNTTLSHKLCFAQAACMWQLILPKATPVLVSDFPEESKSEDTDKITLNVNLRLRWHRTRRVTSPGCDSEARHRYFRD